MRSVLRRQRLDNRRTDASTCNPAGTTPAFHTWIWRRIYGTVLPIPIRAVIAPATLALLASGTVIERATAQASPLQDPRSRSPVDLVPLLPIPFSTARLRFTRSPAPTSPPTTSISILSTAEAPVVWPNRTAQSSSVPAPALTATGASLHQRKAAVRLFFRRGRRSTRPSAAEAPHCSPTEPTARSARLASP